ncbi:MAG: hypothetical protein DRP81_07405 [Candidatus Omnitrophota bacterium]|nr:MAG: hypothetical protein DRP81_07405 [Candidatus Omnitrophota bacterium]
MEKQPEQELTAILQEITQLHEEEKNRLYAEIARLKQQATNSRYNPQAVFIVENVIDPILAMVADFLEQLSASLPEEVRKEVLEILNGKFQLKTARRMEQR